MNTEREKFEAWFVRNIPDDVRDNALLALRQSEREDGSYKQPIMQAFWEGWQARAASPQATAPVYFKRSEFRHVKPSGWVTFNIRAEDADSAERLLRGEQVAVPQPSGEQQKGQ